MKYLLGQFSDLTSQIHLAYLMDISTHLNKLDLQLQDSGKRYLERITNIFIFENKLRAFIYGQVLGRIVENNNYPEFATLQALIDDKSVTWLAQTYKKNIKS